MKTNENNTIVAFHIGRGGSFYNAGYLSYIGEQEISYFCENLFMNEDETQYLDSNGNEVGLSSADYNSGIGKINIDGKYDTTYTKYLEDCNEDEIFAIRRATGYRGYHVEEFLEELKSKEE